MLINFKDNISFFKKNDFILIKPYSNIFNYGKIKHFPNGKFNISIFNKDKIIDFTYLDDFANSLSVLFGPDQNNYSFDFSIEDKSLKYSLCFDFDTLYEEKSTTLILEFWDGIATLDFLGCENIISLEDFFCDE